MDDSAVAGFCGITDAPLHVAKYFLNLTGNDVMQAVGLFYDSPDLAANIPANETPSNAPGGAQNETGRNETGGALQLDSDMEDEEHGEDADAAMARRLEEDEAMARRMQEEMYEGGGVDADGVRAPIARRTETLVGPGADWGPGEDDDQYAEIQRQMNRIRQRQAGSSRVPPNPFNQPPPGSIWNNNALPAQSSDPEEAPAAPSAVSSREARLAEMYRPPTELMNRLPWDHAKEQGKEEEKWLMVNVQNSDVFDCQLLNRDIWKHEGIQETIRENFIFQQYDTRDPASNQYTRFYFQRKDDMDAYPYIAIIDPRTGEQVKVWSGPPVPKPYDFMMQLHDFLDRYSLKVDAKNPVAKRKVEKPAPPLDTERMTEDELLEHVIQRSLQNDNGNGDGTSAAPAPIEEDPDELTKSVGDLGKGKGKAVEDDAMEVDAPSNGNGSSSTTASPFSLISSTNPHVAPANEPGITGRIQFRHSTGRVIRTFNLKDPIRRVYEWLKAEPLEGKEGQVFELKYNGNDLLDRLDESIKDVGLGGATVMIEYVEE